MKSTAVALVVATAVLVTSPRIARAGVDDDLRTGDKFFEEGDWAKAGAGYDRAIATGAPQVTALIYAKRAAIFVAIKDWKGGLAFVDNARAKFPNAPEVLEQEALILWENDRKDDAAAVAERVIAARPKTYSNLKLLGEYYATKDPAKTAAAFEAYLATRPSELEASDLEPRIQLGYAYLGTARMATADGNDSRSQQQYQRAIDQFELIEKKLGKKPGAMVNADNGLCAAYAGLTKWEQAIAVCERVVADPKHIDTTGAVWFNLATAYLARNDPKQARQAATEFLKLRKGEARGHILLGDTFFADHAWKEALEQYQLAEKQLKPNQTREQVQLSIRLGKTYRRLPGGNANANVAIDKLNAAFNANPSNLELAAELGNAYFESHQDAKAQAIADKVLAEKDFAKAPAEQRAGVIALAGKAMFNQHKLKEARQRFESALQLKPTDAALQRLVIDTINQQAYEAANDKAQGPKVAQTLLEQALAIDANSPTTLSNFAVLAIDRNDCDAALKQLGRLRDARGADPIATARLTARAYLCATKPDVKRASDAYGIAEREAKKANAQAALAEIYTEWAPLLWDVDLNDAIAKLEQALQTAGQDPDVAPAAKRNLALALYRRGWRSSKDGKAADALADFERAVREPSVLRGTEPQAFEFSYALALLDGGRTTDAARVFKGLAAKGKPEAYLRGAYAKSGTELFSAYASYRSATGNARQQSCTELAKLEPEIGARAKEMIASCWEMVAYDQWRNGNNAAALRALQSAEAGATKDQRRRIDLDRIALSLTKDKIGELEALAGYLPDALVDLGIAYELAGKPKEAFDAWSKARARGANARDLQRWIDGKKRIYGF